MHFERLPYLFLALAACSPGETSGVEGDPIIGGRDESFFVPVGTLVDTATDGTYLGSYCTGTLIRPHWVLTAAHCVLGTPGTKYFYLGEDSRVVNGQLPPGAFARVAEEIVHPDYLSSTSSSTLADIALLRLYDEVEGVAPYPIDPSGVVPGESLRYVGYGVDGTYDPNSGGRKRSTDLTVAPSANYVQPSWFASYRPGTNVCFGDSGGPSLRRTGLQWYVVGVNSSVFGTDPDLGQNPCDAGSIQVRVDFFAGWIASVIPNVSKPKCDGLYDCLVTCEDPTCQQSCVDLSAPEALTDFLPLNDCLANRCATSTSATCLEDMCGAEYAFCIPPDGCSLQGGGCPVGEACFTRFDGANECFPTDGFPIGSACDPNLIQCDDGSFCQVDATGTAGVCTQQ